MGEEASQRRRYTVEVAERVEHAQERTEELRMLEREQQKHKGTMRFHLSDRDMKLNTGNPLHEWRKS